MLGQLKVHQKSNEITAIPTLLKTLNIKGCIVTLDAMGTQKGIAAQILQQEADYVLALKGNHGKLYQQVQQAFQQAEREGFIALNPDEAKSTEAGHDRIDLRHCYAFPVSALGDAATFEAWEGVQSVLVVVSERRLVHQTTRETRFYLSSLPPQAKVLGDAVRSYWGIENEVHWVLDVVFHEDDSRIRKDHAPENLALLRCLSLNLLRQERTCRRSIKQKQFKAAMDNDYMLKILQAACSIEQHEKSQVSSEN